MHSLFHKEMTRREFLTACGALLFALIGITAIIRNVTSIFSDATAPTAARANAGFGIGPYGS